MKRIFPLTFPFLLAGCPSIGDRIPVDYPATANLRESKVCITVQPQGDEKLAGISIYRLDEAQNRTFKFFDPLRDVAPNQCVPDEGYVFTPGQCKHTRFSSTHFLRLPCFQPSAGTLPASGCSAIREGVRCYIPSASAL